MFIFIYCSIVYTLYVVGRGNVNRVLLTEFGGP